MGWRLPKGTLDPIYRKVAKAAGVTDGRDELARLTKIPETNLSGINSGKRDISMGYVKRIVAAVPDVSPVELGAPLEEDDVVGKSIFDRLEELEAGFVGLGKQLERLEHPDDAQELPAPPKRKRSGSPRDKSKR